MNKLNKIFLIIIIILVISLIIMTTCFFNMKKVALYNYSLYKNSEEHVTKLETELNTLVK